MEAVSSELHAKEQLRTQQRELLLDPLSPPTRQFLTYFIPSGQETSPAEEGFGHNMRRMTSEFGENTHVLLFGLAATSKNPQELKNIFMVLSSLEDVKWNMGKSIKNFVKSLANPAQISISPQARLIAEKMLKFKDEKFIAQAFFNQSMLDYRTDRPHLLEAFFNVVNSPQVPNPKKEKLLQHLTDIRPLLLTNYKPTMFDKDASFWQKVDNSWLFLPGEEVSSEQEFPDDPFPELTRKNEGLRKFADQLAQRNQELAQTVIVQDAKIETLENESKKQTKDPPEIITVTRDIFKLLGLTSDAPPTTVRKEYRKRAVATHPDSLRGKLEKSGIFRPEEIKEIVKAAELSIQDLNQAYTQYNNRSEKTG